MPSLTKANPVPGHTRQEKYAAKKTETHKRVCVWVPREREEDYMDLVAKAQRKWSRQGRKP